MKSIRITYQGVSGIIEHFPQIKCSVGISHSVEVPFHLRGQGLGSKAHEYRLKVAKYEGFKYLLCSVRADNHAQHAIMRKFDWKQLDQTDTYCHNITLYGKDLETMPRIILRSDLSDGEFNYV